AGQIDAVLPAVNRLGELRGEEVRLILVVGRDGESCVIVSPTAQAAIGAHHRPGVAAVLATPQRSALRLLPVVGWHAVAGFDERVDAGRIAARDLRRDFPDGRFGEAMPAQPLPCGASVYRLEQSTAG